MTCVQSTTAAVLNAVVWDKFLIIQYNTIIKCYYYYWPTSTKPVGTKTLRKCNNGLQRDSWPWRCFEMRPHSPSVCHGQLVEQEGGLPGIACNVGRPSLNLLYQFHRLMVLGRYPLSQWPSERTHECWIAGCTWCSCWSLHAWLAAAPASLTVFITWASAYVSGTVTSQANDLPLDKGRMVVPLLLLLLLWIVYGLDQVPWMSPILVQFLQPDALPLLQPS